MTAETKTQNGLRRLHPNIWVMTASGNNPEMRSDERKCMTMITTTMMVTMISSVSAVSSVPSVSWMSCVRS